MQYIDYKNVLGKYELKEPEGIDASKKIIKPVLVVSHELSRTGAPIVLFDLVQILKKSGYDVFVVSSIKEATSAIAVEGLMKEKICICSDICGVVNYLKDKESALIFPCGDSVALAEKIKYVIDNRCCLENIRKNGRMVYEKIYSMEALERGWNNIVQKFNSEYIEKYTIDVVIYNYNSTEYILQTLDSIDQGFYSNMNIIVVDDASENNCLSVLENRYADRNNVMYIQNDEHMGMYEICSLIFSE